MLRKKHTRIRWYAGVVLIFSWVSTAQSESNISSENIYPVGKLKPRDSIPVLEIGDQAPDFTLPAVSGEKVSLGDYRGKKNVVISFVPAAFTPVCSMQWPVYNLTKDIFDKNGAMLLGITVDNIPSLYAWTSQMVEGEDKVWFRKTVSPEACQGA
jgi:peroxiredoxin (alkyl hydroperoxide reductase subunit C)